VKDERLKIGDLVQYVGYDNPYMVEGDYNDRHYLHGKIGVIVHINNTNLYPVNVQWDTQNKPIKHYHFELELVSRNTSSLGG